MQWRRRRWNDDKFDNEMTVPTPRYVFFWFFSSSLTLLYSAAPLKGQVSLSTLRYVTNVVNGLFTL